MNRIASVLCAGLFLASTMAGAATVFEADFQASTTAIDTTLANVNAGTAAGTWTGLPDGLADGVDIVEELGNPSGVRALLLDRFPDPIDGTANFTQAIDRDTASIAFVTAILRTSDDRGRDVTFVGLDASGAKSFELVFVNINTGVGHNRIHYMDPVNGVTPIPQGVDGEIPNVRRDRNNPTFRDADGHQRLASMTVTCSPAGYVVTFTPGVADVDAIGWTSDVLPYSGAATEIAKIGFSAPDALAGFWFDEMLVDGTPPGVGGEGEGEGEGEPAGAGDTITASAYPPFIDEGMRLVLEAPAGTNHQWMLNGGSIEGATSNTLVRDPVTTAHEGDYTVQYDDGTKVLVVSESYILTVGPGGTVPVAGLLGLALLTSACGLGGASLVRRKRS